MQTQPPLERGGVGVFLWTVTAVAAAVVGGTKGVAAGVGDRAKTGGVVCDHNANVALLFAFDADAMLRDIRPFINEEGGDNLE